MEYELRLEINIPEDNISQEELALLEDQFGYIMKEALAFLDEDDEEQ